MIIGWVPKAGRALLAGTAALAAVCAGATACGPTSSADADGLTVLAAASLADVLTEIGETFEAQHSDVTITFSYGASSELATQVVAGAPADLLLTANEATMRAVLDAGLVTGEPARFATNELVIAVPIDNPGQVDSVADLADPDLVIALCAPEVPCGTAARELLSINGVDVEPDTLEDDARAALTRVQLGEVDAALVYRTDVMAAGGSVTAVPVDRADEARTTYVASVLAAADNAGAAAAFLAHLGSPAARAALDTAGFGPPPS